MAKQRDIEKIAIYFNVQKEDIVSINLPNISPSQKAALPPEQKL
jgi:hypothetical protein